MTTKVCEVCGHEKPLTEFRGCGHNHYRTCKTCTPKHVSNYLPEVCVIRWCYTCKTVYIDPDSHEYVVESDGWRVVRIPPAQMFNLHKGKLRSQCRNCRTDYARAYRQLAKDVRKREAARG